MDLYHNGQFLPDASPTGGPAYVSLDIEDGVGITWVITRSGGRVVATPTATGGAGAGVTSLDALTGAVALHAGSGISITDNSPSAGNITIANTVLTLATLLAGGNDASGNRIVNLGAPSAQTDAATKGYVDAMTFNNQSGTTYTLVLADQGKAVTLTSATGCTLTIPTNASVAFPVGTQIIVRSGTSAGTITVAAAGGVTLTNPYSSFNLAAASAQAILLKIGTDAWSLNGEVA